MPEGRPDSGDGAPLPAPAAAIAAHHASGGPAVGLGSLLWEGTAYPGVQVGIPLSVLNRHGLVAGGDDDGRTEVVRLLAERLSAQGVPVLLADIEGALSGVSAPGAGGDRVRRRAAAAGQHWTATGFPADFHALGGLGGGIPVRTTATGFGPLLMARALGLDHGQERSLDLVYRYADAKGAEMYDLEDLRAVTAFLGTGEGRADAGPGGLPPDAAGELLRTLTVFDARGASAFFGEPGFDTADLLRTAEDGRGVVSVIGSAAVRDRPRLFSAFLLWLLADLCQGLPEAGDPGRPVLVVLLGGTRPLFDGAGGAFLESVTRMVRHVRTKGVGVFFAAGTPKDVPEELLGLLGNRVVRRADAEATATVTVAGADGTATTPAETLLRAPESSAGPLDPADLDSAVRGSALYLRYSRADDRKSAFEKLVDVRSAAEAVSRPPSAGRGASPAGSASAPPLPAAGDEGLVERVAGTGVFTALAGAAGRPGSTVGPAVTRSLLGVRGR
ncbi:helicase HerA-like domain-containing protein [Streptomyces sp. NPDC049040]|uniref:helicase HerA-like domain-containing protein n=1 Tax=Streptomyces sp. NPDC049040 TaxID=3365593 RepID=UPI003716B7DB